MLSKFNLKSTDSLIEAVLQIKCLNCQFQKMGLSSEHLQLDTKMLWLREFRDLPVPVDIQKQKVMISLVRMPFQRLSNY